MRTLAGLALPGLALLVGGVAAPTLADPAGAALANDADPFAPGGRSSIDFLWMAAAAALAWSGFRLLNRGAIGRAIRGRGFPPESIR